MKPLVHVAWTLVAVVAFVLGTFVSDPPRPNSPVAVKNEPGTQQEAQVRVLSEERFVPLNAEGMPNAFLSPEQTRARTFEVLSEANRTKRMRKLTELLEHVTRENWREVVEAFLRQTIHEGRTHDQEWFLTLERIGEIAGSEAVDDAVNSKNPNGMERARRFLVGWAGSEPDQALAWLQSQSPEVQGQLIQPLINGMAKANPKQALELAMLQPEQLQEATIGLVVDAAIQRGGYSAAEGLLKPLIGRTGIEDGTRGKLFYNIARRKLSSARLDGNPFEALDWFDGYLGDGSPAGAIATQELIGSTAAVNAEATIKWLEERADRFGAYKSAAAYPVAARAWQAQEPDKFAAWLDAHPDHPQRDAMAAAAANVLLQMRKLDDAKRLGATVRDEKLRAQLENAFQKYSK